uniref:Putative secreted protein n=1 Tax=Anopheles triannulatus TaxID=58253 RepID=A0A2M4B1H7_9DIPT
MVFPPHLDLRLVVFGQLVALVLPSHHILTQGLLYLHQPQFARFVAAEPLLLPGRITSVVLRSLRAPDTVPERIHQRRARFAGW